MRIVHVVTLVSADGAFGGPVTVARQQCDELSRRGHDVTLVAGWDGRADLRAEFDVHLFRTHRLVPGCGFSGLVAPALWRHVRAVARTADVLHVHLARDLVTLPASRVVVGRVPIVIQSHGMIQGDERMRARVLDSLMTRKVIRCADARATLTIDDAQGLVDVAGAVETTQIRNGVVLPDSAVTADRRKSLLKSDLPTVLFCARLHPRKRVFAFVDAARILIRSGRSARFVIAGPDGGDLSLLLDLLTSPSLKDHISYAGAIAPDDVPDIMGAADVYILPSRDEPFPMSLLEALSSGTPSIITSGVAIHHDLADRKAVIVTDGSPAELANAICTVLDDPNLARSLQDHGYRALSDRYGIASVVDEIEFLYLDAIRHHARKHC